MVDGGEKKVPEWVIQLMKGGGWAAAIAFLYIMVLIPMREDFNDFKRQTTVGITEIRRELKGLNSTITGDLRDRIGVLNQKVGKLEERCESVTQRIERVENWVENHRENK